MERRQRIAEASGLPVLRAAAAVPSTHPGASLQLAAILQRFQTRKANNDAAGEIECCAASQAFRQTVKQLICARQIPPCIDHASIEIKTAPECFRALRLARRCASSSVRRAATEANRDSVPKFPSGGDSFASDPPAILIGSFRENPDNNRQQLKNAWEMDLAHLTLGHRAPVSNSTRIPQLI